MEYYRRALRIREEEIDKKESKIDATLALLREDKDFLLFERKYRSAQFDYAKAVALNKEVEVAKNELLAAQTAFEAKLSSMGKTIEDITYAPSCTVCKDKGYTIGGACKCLIPTIKDCMVKEGDMPYAQSDFDAFSLSLYNGPNQDNASRLVNFIKKWTDGYPNITKNFITIIGKTGVGKTHLATIVANNFLDKGKTVAFYNALSLNKIFLRAHLSPIRERAGILQDVYDVDLLVIDDLGVEQILNNVTIEYLYDLLTERTKKATIITTNLDQNMLKEKYDDRVFSRLTAHNAIVSTLTGDDLRRK